MKRVALLGIFGLLTACSHGLRLVGRPSPESGRDSLYWRALTHLDASNKQGSLDTAVTFLEAYLSSPGTLTHRREALVLKQLARDSRQLARVEVALQQARGDSTLGRPHSEAEAKRRDEEAVKEIQRLKDELAKANEELERIRKRLATPKPPAR